MINKFEIGQKVEIEIEKIVFGGEGIGRVDGFAIFVPMSVPGDRLEIEIISLKKTYGRGLITRIIEPSKDRVEDLSKVSFEDFDGCDFGMLKYEKQLEYKDKMLEEVLTKIAEIDLKKVKISKIIGSDKKVVRTMPNTPAQVMEGMTAVSFNSNIEENEKKVIFKLLNSFGKSIEIDEKLMHVYTGISGSLPAYVYVFIEALADGGVLEGMPRDKAYEIIAQAVLGSAKMMLETKKHPGILKDEVTSPGGTTIAALKVLEDGKFRGTVMEAVKACTEKSKEMAQK